jgi:hypothetical protein
LIGSLLLDVEVLDLIGGSVGCDHVQELSKTVLLEVFLGEVLEVSLGEGDVGLDRDALVVTGNAHNFSEVASPSSDFDASTQELSEIVGIEDLILDGFGAIDGESV